MGRTVNQYNLDGTTAKVPFISTGLNLPVGLAMDGDSLFVSDFMSGIVGKYNINTGAAINASFVNVGNDAAGIHCFSGLLLVTSPSGDFVRRYSSFNGSSFGVMNVGVGRPVSVVRDPNGDYLVAKEVTSAIAKFKYSDLSSINGSFITTGVQGPSDMAFVGNNLAVVNGGNDRVSLYTAAGALVNANFIKVDDGAFAIAVIGENTPHPKPTLTVTGSKKITTTKSTVTLKGSVKNATTVELKINGKKPVKLAKTSSWSYKVSLKKGKNTIVVVSRGKGGASKSVTVVVTRKTKKAKNAPLLVN
ncbi:MAG: hypothetical protein EOP85_21445 [Verrucomicrobiaceae bacterium]|nr:MAG: hypothetical protein EOP85_21445 [Verrucomicrobiaceae bacterium]